MPVKMAPKKILKFLSSVKLAVVIILYLCVVIAWGTIVESQYDAQAAKVKVYDSIWMYLGFTALTISLVAVMVDRWPWKPRHAAFVCAHIGIIAIIIGSIQTLRYGIDGSMIIGIGQGSKHVTVTEQQILIYASFDGSRMSKIFEKDVNFLKHPLKDPLVIPTEAGDFKFVEFKPYVTAQRNVVAGTEKQLGAGIRFQIANEQFQHIDWLVQKKIGSAVQQDLGPLRLRLGPMGPRTEKRNEVVFEVFGPQKIRYQIFSKDKHHAIKKGEVKEGGSIELGWMGLKLKVLRYLPQALEKWDIKEKASPTPLTVSAVKFVYKNQDHWILLNDTLRVFSDKAAYFISYLNKQLPLDFSLVLKEFVKENYAGTQKAMTYKSLVEIPGHGEHEITMNEPLDWKGLTFYQASFQEDQFGQPVASVLSVNYDPGRFFKYGGSLIMVLGIILLFYFRRQKKS
jgi:hypothetical protein